MVLVGCGSSGSAVPGLGASEDMANCRIPVPGATSDRIQIENSGIPCQQAAAMVLLLTSGRSAQLVKAGGVTWTCVSLPRSMGPLEVRCRDGRRHFTVER